MNAGLDRAWRAPAPREELGRGGQASSVEHPSLDGAARRANAGPHAASLSTLQSIVAQRACADCQTVERTLGGGAPVQRTVAEDVEAMGLGDGLRMMTARSPSAARLVAQADGMNVRVVRGGTHARTERTQGGGQLRISIPASESGMTAMQSILFELQNAVRQDHMEALSARAVSGEIADEDEFAREKIKVEIAGMLATGQIAHEHNQSGEAQARGERIPINAFFLSRWADFLGRFRADPFLTRDQYASSIADSVLDTPHQSGSHRQVYRGQFNALANGGNREARARSSRLKGRAGQVSAMASMIDMGPAVDKLWDETGDGPEVAAWLEPHRDADRWGALYGRMMGPLAERMRRAVAEGNGEEAVTRLGRGAASTLHSWLEAHDEGEYGDLSQLLGLYLGHYRNHPEHLTQGTV